MATLSDTAAPKATRTGELPAEPFRPSSPWARGVLYWLSNVDRGAADAADLARRDWVAATPFAAELTSAVRAAARARDQLARHQRDPRAVARWPELQSAKRRADDRLRPLLTEAIARGLRRREGLYLRDEYDEAIIATFRALGGEPPEGIAACEDCRLVFRPRRRYAAKCDRCHGKPRSPAMTFERRSGGGCAFHAPPPFGTIRQHVCVQCGDYYNPSRADSRFCSAACKKAAWAAGGPPVDGPLLNDDFGVWLGHTVIELLNAAHERGLYHATEMLEAAWPVEDDAYDLDAGDEPAPEGTSARRGAQGDAPSLPPRTHPKTTKPR